MARIAVLGLGPFHGSKRQRQKVSSRARVELRLCDPPAESPRQRVVADLCGLYASWSKLNWTPTFYLTRKRMSSFKRPSRQPDFRRRQLRRAGAGCFKVNSAMLGRRTIRASRCRALLDRPPGNSDIRKTIGTLPARRRASEIHSDLLPLWEDEALSNRLTQRGKREAVSV
jgi:hypothetical protein